jgi:hypothetical protein
MTEAEITITRCLRRLQEKGQLVRLRNRFYLVRDVFLREVDRGVSTRLELECLDDDRLREDFSVLWEREVHPRFSRRKTTTSGSPSERIEHPRRVPHFPERGGNCTGLIRANPHEIPWNLDS